MLTVSEEFQTYKELSDDAKKQARHDFMDYYIRGFRNDNLELISSLADDRDLAMINHLLGENRFQTIDQLIPLCEGMVKSRFDAILSDIDMKYSPDGDSKQAWSAWEQELHDKLPVED